MSKIVFLGGTAGANHWREEKVIPALIAKGVPAESLFNPIVKDWNAEAQANEDLMKRTATYNLFVITNPFTPGNLVSAYSIFEVIVSLYGDPGRTVAVLDLSDFDETKDVDKAVMKALRKGFKDLKAKFPVAPIFETLDEAIDWLAVRLLS